MKGRGWDDGRGTEFIHPRWGCIKQNENGGRGKKWTGEWAKIEKKGMGLK